MSTYELLGIELRTYEGQDKQVIAFKLKRDDDGLIVIVGIASEPQRPEQVIGPPQAQEILDAVYDAIEGLPTSNVEMKSIHIG